MSTALIAFVLFFSELQSLSAACKCEPTKPIFGSFQSTTLITALITMITLITALITLITLITALITMINLEDGGLGGYDFAF